MTGRLATECPTEVTDATMRRAWEEMHRGSERAARLPAHLVDVDMAGWNTVAAAHAIATLYPDDPEAGIGFAAAAASVDADCVDASGFILWDRVKPAHFCGAPYHDMFVAAYETMRVEVPYVGPEVDAYNASEYSVFAELEQAHEDQRRTN